MEVLLDAVFSFREFSIVGQWWCGVEPDMVSKTTSGLALGSGRLLSADDSVRSDWGRLARYLNAHGMSVDLTQPVRQFAGGLANRNFLLVVNGEPSVLRRPPDGDLPPGAHDM